MKAAPEGVKMVFELRKWAADLNEKADVKRLKNAETRQSASEIWAWLGLDREHANAFLGSKAAGGKFYLSPAILGVADYEKVAVWMSENAARVTPELLVHIAALGFMAGRSDVKKRQAAAKNESARSWVFMQWILRTDKGQSKAAFARQYAALVKHRFPKISVTPDTIARDWLPKVDDPAA
jgi:hypothetical protein